MRNSGTKYVATTHQDIHHVIEMHFYEPQVGRRNPDHSRGREIAELKADRDYTDEQDRDLTECRPDS